MTAQQVMPCRADFNPARLPRLLAGISLIDVHSDIHQCRVRLAGTRLREVFDREITGSLLSEVAGGAKLDYWMAAYRRTIETATPTQGVVRGPMVHKEHVVQYWMKLPLRTTSPAVGMVLCYDHFVLASEIHHEQEARTQAAS